MQTTNKPDALRFPRLDIPFERDGFNRTLLRQLGTRQDPEYARSKG